MERVGVIGLGRMGSAIARRMASEGRPVMGWTRSGRAVEGVTSAPDLDALVSASDTLILSLYDDQAVASVLDALLAYDLTGKLIIETSTVVPDVLKSRYKQLTELGADAVDAPISGGPEMVTARSCGVFIGGSDDAFARARESLSAISERIFHVGPLGAGLVMKTINNGMLQTYFNGLTEFIPMAKRAGMPLERTLRILCGGPAGMPMVADRIPKVLGEDDTVGFSLNAVFKDTDVFRRVVESFGLDAPMLEAFAALQSRVDAAGWGERDPAALVNLAYDEG